MNSTPPPEAAMDESINQQLEAVIPGAAAAGSIDLLCKAMAQAFPKIANAVKGSTNPHFKSSYADLAAVVDAVRPALGAHGLWFTQFTHMIEGGGVVIETLLFHESGQMMSMGKLAMPVSKPDAQGLGSALTYCKRYSLMSAFGVPAEDDDGNGATGRPAPGQAAAPAILPVNLPKLDPDRRMALTTQFRATKSLQALDSLWKTMSNDERRVLLDLKNEQKERIAAEFINA